MRASACLQRRSLFQYACRRLWLCSWGREREEGREGEREGGRERQQEEGSMFTMLRGLLEL